MNPHLQAIYDRIQQLTAITNGDKEALFTQLQKANKAFEEQTGQLKNTKEEQAKTAALLKERTEELEQHKKVVETHTHQLHIEASLDRLRAGATAMQSSNDLASAVVIIFEELNKLNMDMLRCGIGILDEQTRSAIVWTSAKSIENTPLLVSGIESMDIHPLLQGAFAAWQKQEEYTYVLQGEDFVDYYKTQSSAQYHLPGSTIFLTTDAERMHYYFMAPFQAGGLFAFSESPFSDEAKWVMKRFAGVFHLTYKRFIDLQRAEALAKEAQIEVALERVRSSSLAMYKSSELKEVVKVVFDNLQSLGIKKMDSVNINIFHSGSKEFDLWLAAPGQDYTKNFRLPYYNHPIANDFFEAMERGQKLHKKVYPYDQKNDYFRYMFENSDNKYLPQERKDLILSGAAYAVSAAIASHSAIFVHNYHGEALSGEDDSVLMRFATVFDQAYKRYLDLYKAELLVRETLRQASLDRIRSEVANMRSTDDLQRITPLLWQELGRLEIPFIRCGVFIIDEAAKIIHTYLSTPDGHSLGVMHLPFDRDDLTTKAVEYWHKKDILRHHWNKAELLQWIQTMLEEGQIQSLDVFKGDAIYPESLHLHLVPFIQGLLYVGNTEPLSIYQLDLIKSMADAFSIAYARYEDFAKLEKAKQSIEATLTELKAMQSQLIHAEKMASLGELTAGVAHEIQNPLNFVNNFAEVNKELITELKAELKKGNSSEAQTIAASIEENEEKITHHGKRADAIVKSMLQHSRKHTGQMEPTNINALADEYLQLSYHGIRAKDKNFTADIKTNLDAAIGMVTIIPQDIGRVLLNLYNNAFYAVKEKKKTAGDAYRPLVAVCTKKRKNIVEISISDNGNGIPEKVVDKIFQPFFTTKPTGQGTGLGLSLSHDIIKAHGGELKMESKEGEGSTIIITLPL